MVHEGISNRLWLVAVALLLAVGVVGWRMHVHQRYQLGNAAQTLVGATSPKLAKKINYDAASGVYHFNRKRTLPVSKEWRQKIGKGGKSLYRVDMPTEASKGFTVYDSNTGLKFTMQPQFQSGKGQLENDHLIFPLKSGPKAIYSVKGNGLKEDIVFQHAPKSGKAQFTYKLNLPDTLQARQMDNGNIGIYSADATLYGNITYGSPTDKMKLMSARKSSAKNNLVFLLPAPKITTPSQKCPADSGQKKQTSPDSFAQLSLSKLLHKGHSPKKTDATGVQRCVNRASDAQARFVLQGDTLTVETSHLSHISGPFSIDPSVVVTSSADFSSGNTAGNIDVGNGDITRGNLTGGALGNWNATKSLPAARNEHSSAVYNGYIYVMGGIQGTATVNDVYYAPLSDTGQVGAWQSDSAINLPGPRRFQSSVAYDGYLYVIGGSGGNNNALDSVYYTKLQSNGRPVSPGTCQNVWCPTTALPGTSTGNAAVVSNGYIYVMDGTGSMSSSEVAFAEINADGQLGAWTSTTSLPSALSGSSLGQAAAYNGYLYISGGYNSGSNTYLSDVYFAELNSDGTVAAWHQATSLPQGLVNHAMLAYDGYLYVSGGANSGGDQSAMYYAPVYVNGKVGNWRTTASLPNPVSRHTSVAANGYLYTLGGSSGATAVNYAKIEPAGGTDSYTPSQNTFANARANFASVATNGYLYVLGGNCNSCSGGRANDVQYAKIGADGKPGTWNTTLSFNGARGSFAATAESGYIYISGGNNGQGTSVEYAPVKSDGTLGAWASTTALPASMSEHAMASYGGYVYVFENGTGSNNAYYAKIQPDGKLGSWRQNPTSFSGARKSFEAVAYGGYVYVLGGISGGSYFDDVQYAKIKDDGSLGSWASTKSFSTARSNFAAAADRGYLYILGGGDNSGTLHNDVEYDRIDPSNGKLSNWQATQSFATARNSLEGVAYDGYMYVLGGYGGGQRNDTQYARIGNGGSGVTGSWQTASNKFATPRDAHTSVVHDGYLYVIGGVNNNGTMLASVQYTKLENDGSFASSGSCSNVWCATASLPNGLAYHSSTIYGNYVYVVGGKGGNSQAKVVYYAQFGADGQLGQWTPTTELPKGRYSNSSVAHDGYVYSIGGVAHAPHYHYDFEHGKFSDFQSNGWVLDTSQSNSPTHSAHSNVDPGRGNNADVTISLTKTLRNDGYISFFSKTDMSTRYGTQYYFQFSIDGNVVSTATDTHDWQASTYVVKNTNGNTHTFTWRIYKSGYWSQGNGAWIDDIDIVDGGGKTASFENGFEDGNLDPFTSNSWSVNQGDNPPEGTHSAQSADVGEGDSTMTWMHTLKQDATVSFYRKVNTPTGYGAGYLYFCVDDTNCNHPKGQWSGSLGWQKVSFNVPAGQHTFTWQVTGTFRYYDHQARIDDVTITNFSDLVASGKTLYSQVQSGGGLGAWRQGSDVPENLYGLSAVAYNGYVYAIGGVGKGDIASSNVYYAKFGNTGTVGAWHATSSLPGARYYQSSVVYNGFVYVMGGLKADGSPTDSVLAAPINANGTLGAWQQTASLPRAADEGAAATAGGYVYFTGGVAGGSPSNAVDHASLQTIPRVSQYSKLIDFGTDATQLTSIGYTGDVPGGIDSIKYRKAGADGKFDADAGAPSLNASDDPGVNGRICRAPTLAGTRYVWVSVALDDTARAVFPDASAAHATVNDITVNYDVLRLQAPPNLRLRGGAFFYQQTLQPLDTCKS